MMGAVPRAPFQVEMPPLLLGVMTPDLRQRLGKFLID
jgi:hypothetical protein